MVFGTIDRIKKAIEKGEYEKAYELIKKGYEKEPLNPGISYYHAYLFFEETYAEYNLDTARVAINRSMNLFETASEDLIEDLEKENLTQQKAIKLSEKIRDQSFLITLSDLTLDNIQAFRGYYPNSIYDEILRFKSDSIDFRHAEDTDTKDAFINFIANHPTSIFTPKADSILDGMRVEELELNGNLNDYYSFLKRYPLTRFRDRVENYIFRISTASHSPSSYQAFITFSQIDRLKQKAKDLLYFLDPRNPGIQSDSINDIKKHAQSKLFPVIQNNLIGFHNATGELKVNYSFVEIPEEYKCSLLTDAWIFSKTDDDTGMICGKNGDVILRNIDSYRNLSDDLGLISRSNEWWLYHKSGFSILDYPIQQAELLDAKWIKIRRNGKWGLVSYLGLDIAETRYDEISKEGVFWVFEKDGLIAVYTEPLIIDEIENRGLSLEFKFDDIELINQHSFIGFRDNRECLLDSTLSFLVPWGEYEINPEASGWYLKSDKGYRLYNSSEEEVMKQHYPYLESNDGWLAIKTGKDWMLLPRKGNLLPSRDYDSIKLVNDHSAIIIKDDTKTLIFTSGNSISLEDHQVQTFLNQPNFIRVSSDKKITLYDRKGESTISGEFDEFSFLNDTLVRVQVRKKFGLMNTNGDWILNPVFEGLDEKDGLILTLIDGKIGCYDPEINVLIEAKYESRIERLGTDYLAKKQGKHGIIDFTQKEVLSFIYDEIHQWNDTSFLIKKESEFSLIDKNEDTVYEPFQSIKPLCQSSNHNIYRFVQNGKYGLLSSRFGELLKAEFTDIFNISTSGIPFFFADQHLSKAGFHVVSYIDEKGNLILSKAYTKAEFEQILCDD